MELNLFSAGRSERMESERYLIVAESAMQAHVYYELNCEQSYTVSIIRESGYTTLVTSGDYTKPVNVQSLIDRARAEAKIPSLVGERAGMKLYLIGEGLEEDYGVMAGNEPDALEVFRHAAPLERYMSIMWQIQDERYHEHGTGDSYVYPVHVMTDWHVITIVDEDGIEETATVDDFVHWRAHKDRIYIGELLFVRGTDGVMRKGKKVWKY